MSKSQEIVTQLKKLEEREERWLAGEQSYIKQLEAGIAAKDVKKVEQVINVLGRYEQILERYHQRAFNAIVSLEEQGLLVQYKQKLEQLNNQIQINSNTLKFILSKHAGQLRNQLQRRDWQALETLSYTVQEKIAAWIVLDRNLLQLEQAIYDSDEQVGNIIHGLIREVEEHPESVDPKQLLYALKHALANAPTRRSVKEWLKVVMYGSKKVLRFSRFSVRTVALYIVVYYLPTLIIGFLQKSEHHETIAQIELILTPDIIKKTLDTLPRGKREILLKQALTDNKKLIEEEVEKFAAAIAQELYSEIITRIWHNQGRLYAQLRAKPNFDLSKIKPFINIQQAEAGFIMYMGKDRNQILAEITYSLRQYYVLEIIEERLPGTGDLAQDLLNGDLQAAFNNLRWGAAEPKVTTQTEDVIRRRIGAMLEPHLNDIKAEIRKKLLFEDYWRQVETAIVKTIEDPSKASKLWEELAMRTGTTVALWILIAGLVLVLGLGWPLYKAVRAELRDVRWIVGSLVDRRKKLK